MSYILIAGAKSDVAKELAICYAKNNYDIYLAARDSKDLEPFAKNLSIREGQKIECLELDILDMKNHQLFYDSLTEKPYGFITAVGYLGDQKMAENSFSEVEKIILSNFLGNVGLINIVANDFEKRRTGFIIGLSSVAGDRGRKKNYFYGSSKAGFSAYLSGLRNRLNDSNVQVLTVKPGFINTKMTKGLKLPKLLTAEPSDVASDIVKAQIKNKQIIYTKGIWKIIMFIVNAIPEKIFKKMNF